MKVYEAKLKKDTEVESFSLVLGAAVETKLSKFAEETETPIFFANEEKRIIYSVAMRPNKMIFRKDIKGEPANVFFSSDTVEQIQQSYFRSNNKGLVKMNLNHSEDKVDGIYPIESWIVNDAEVDKSKTLFMEDVKKGDLIIGYKIDNNDVWENFIKTGEVDGLSVEALLDYEIINPKITMNTEKSKDGFFAHMAKYFAADVVEEEVKVEEEMAEVPIAETEVEEEIDYKAKNEELMATIADLKEQVANLQGEKVVSETALTTMTSEKSKVENEFATFKAENLAIKNVPNEKIKTFAEMTPVEKFRASKNN